MPSSSDIENVQSDLDIDLSSSGAVLIDIRRRFTDFRNMTKRLAVRTAGGMVPSSSTQERPTRNAARSSSQRGAYPAMGEEDDMQDPASIWAAPPNLLAKSPSASFQSNGAGFPGDDAGDSSEDDDDDDTTQKDRYTFYPHRQRSGSIGSAFNDDGQISEAEAS